MASCTWVSEFDYYYKEEIWIRVDTKQTRQTVSLSLSLSLSLCVCMMYLPRTFSSEISIISENEE